MQSYKLLIVVKSTAVRAQLKDYKTLKNIITITKYTEQDFLQIKIKILIRKSPLKRKKKATTETEGGRNSSIKQKTIYG